MKKVQFVDKKEKTVKYQKCGLPHKFFIRRIFAMAHGMLGTLSGSRKAKLYEIQYFGDAIAFARAANLVSKVEKAFENSGALFFFYLKF